MIIGRPLALAIAVTVLVIIVVFLGVYFGGIGNCCDLCPNAQVR